MLPLSLLKGRPVVGVPAVNSCSSSCVCLPALLPSLFAASMPSDTTRYCSIQTFFVLLQVRLATVIPYSATNALLPITDMTLWQYTLGSAIGILPGVCLFVLIGELAGSIADVSSGGMSEASSPAVVFATVGVSIVVLVILVVVLTRYAKKALAQQLDKMDGEEGAQDAAAEGESASEAQPAEAQAAEAQPAEVVAVGASSALALTTVQIE